MNNSGGHHYIYFVLDWEKPGKAMVTVFGTLMLAIFMHVALFWVYKLRVFVQKRCFGEKKVLPLTNPKHKLTHNGSQISMVFGDKDNGCTNEAFTNSTGKMSA